MIRRLALLFVLFLTPAFAAAQPLADRVPADAIVYLGWQGSERLPASYDKSRFKAALDTSGLREFYNQSIPQLMQVAARADREAAEMVRVFDTLVVPMLKHPTAVYFAGVELGNQQPTPKFAVLCDAGGQADAVVQQLNQLLAMAGPAPFPVMAYKQETLAVLSVGYARQGDAVATADRSILTAAPFKAALAQAGKEPLVVAYADAAAVMALVERIGQQVNDQEFNQNWPKVRDALGLGGLKQLIWTAGFDGQDWGSHAFIAAPAPRKGLLAMLDAKPLSDEALSAVPKTANWMMFARFDVAGLLQSIRDGGANFDPNFPRMFDQGVGAVQAATTVNPMELFGALGDEWVAYVDPNVVGIGPLGITVVNRLRDPAAAERNLKKLHTQLGNLINVNLPKDPPIRVNFATSKVGELTIYHVKAPFFSPAWTIRDGNLYAGAYLQVVAEAAARGGSRQGSILENEKFTALRDRLGGGKAHAISYADLQDTAKENYQFFLLGTQVVHGLADMFGAETPPFLIPPLRRLMPHLAPAGGVVWADDAGWHARSVEPWPGSQALASQGGLILAAAPVFAGVAVPATFRAREQANRVKAASNLRQIGMGCFLYANENRNKFPPDFGTLILTQDLAPDVFVSPASGKAVPSDVRAGTKQAQAAWVNQNADYVYVGGALNANAPAERILAHEKFELNNGQGVNVLFADGHVEWMITQMAMDRVEQQKRPN